MANELTYQETPLSERLEKYEWDRIWIEDTTDKTAKRVLYIGDSISNGTHPHATRVSERQILFSNFASSKALDNPYYYPQIKMFIDQCERRDAIIFNNGLHGWHLSEEEYGRLYSGLIGRLMRDCPGVPIYLVLTTAVGENSQNAPRVAPRNEEARRVAKSLGLEVIDLYQASLENAELHTSDGVHFTPEGYEALAKAVVDFMKERL